MKIKSLIKALNKIERLLLDKEGLADSISEMRKHLQELLLEEETGGFSGEYPLPNEFTVSDADLILFSDGGCRGNPGPGGWGFVIQDKEGNVLIEESGSDKDTTNNRMELTGAIEALRWSLDNEYNGHVFLVSDSKYVLEGLKTWVAGWKSRGWKKADKKPPENLEYWQDLDNLRNNFEKITTVWVKGHAGHPQNERCDQLANMAMDYI